MTKAQHTPAPWVFWVDDFEVNILSNAGDRSVPIADVCVDEDTTFAPTLPEAVANARLIAAAPELLAVAKWLQKHRGECFIPNPQNDFDDMLTAAIAKAEGGAA